MVNTTNEVKKFEPVELPSKYAKAIVAIVTAVLTVFATALLDNQIDTLELANIGVAFLTAFGVYAIPNFQQNVGAWAKLIVAFVGTGLQALIPFLVEGSVSPAQWMLVAIAALGALGVGIIPNNSTPEKVIEVVDGEVVRVVNPPEVTADATITPTGKHIPPADEYDIGR